MDLSDDVIGVVAGLAPDTGLWSAIVTFDPPLQPVIRPVITIKNSAYNAMCLNIDTAHLLS
jgi:hypothetical protein